MSSKAWLTEDAITQRIYWTGTDFAVKIVRGAIQIYALEHARNTGKRAVFMRRTRRDTRVCHICKPWDGVQFKVGQFMPPIPAHPRCRCKYTLIRFETVRIRGRRRQ